MMTYMINNILIYTYFANEITPEKLSLIVFAMLKCIVIFSCNKYLKLGWLVRTGITELNNTKLQAKFIRIVFSLNFIGIFNFLELNVDNL